MGKIFSCTTKPKKYIAVEFIDDPKEIGELKEALSQFGANIYSQDDGVFISTIIGNSKLKAGDFILINELKMAFIYSKKEFEENFRVHSEC
ncbi:hypothetical protein [Acinetobacter silvestris]|uniref:Uncharacterized protein n=1 Tax=Acinetobacter silvestris TaxID=1977882 RepID=A0A1Y3CIV8_9GAMM|nr:hypothetical protein [Acinetobacter silvestris]OTG65824.1 hypothetical protein B9T28_06385 [Acinetobacter silvestris]